MAMKRQSDDFDPRFDYVIESNPAHTRKYIAAGLGSIFALCLVVSGAVFFVNRAPPTQAAILAGEDSSFRMPSMMGLLVAVSSGGRMSARKYDETMTEMCSQMAGLGVMMSGDDSSEARNAMKRNQANCRSR